MELANTPLFTIPPGATNANVAWLQWIQANIGGATPTRNFTIELRDSGGTPLETLFTMDFNDGLFFDDGFWQAMVFDVSAHAGKMSGLS